MTLVICDKISNKSNNTNNQDKSYGLLCESLSGDGDGSRRRNIEARACGGDGRSYETLEASWCSNRNRGVAPRWLDNWCRSWATPLAWRWRWSTTLHLGRRRVRNGRSTESAGGSDANRHDRVHGSGSVDDRS